MRRGTAPLPPLESGDRLTREEFHRRYCLHPDIRKAELIKGVVYVPSPARFRQHGEPHGVMSTWIMNYALRTPGVRAASEATVFLSESSEVQPDVFLFRDPPQREEGARITERDYVEGAPDLVVEVAASSASYDLYDKLDAYREAGVLEYVVWQIHENRLRWFLLQDGAFVEVAPDERGVIESAVFPGLRLNVGSLLAGNWATVLSENEPPRGSAAMA